MSRDLQQTLLPTPVAVDDLIRMGREFDGGYVVSRRAIEQATVLIGLGINVDWSFEEAFARQAPSSKVFAVDGSVSYLEFMRRSSAHALEACFRLAQADWRSYREQRAQSRFYHRLARDFRRFFSDASHVFLDRMVAEDGLNGAVGWRELVETVERTSGPRGGTKWFVKMDIEGSEYRVLPLLSEHADRITGLAVEFHDCDLLWERFADTLTQLDRDFVLVHAHGNNWAPLIPGTSTPRVLELSFVNRRLVMPEELERVNDRVYPLQGLDMPNAPDRPDYTLPFQRR